MKNHKAWWYMLCAALMPGLVLACIHSPNGYRGEPVAEREKLAFLFHDGANAHLVIRTTLEAKTGLPETMAWVIPLPSLPSKFEEANGGLFEELSALIPRDDPRLPMVAAAAPKAEAPKAPPVASIRVYEKQIVGSYQIQPVEILADSGGDELNAWLSKNGFGTVPPENQKYYLHKGAVFLALRVEGLKGGESELKPLHITYRDDRLRLPLKFSTHSGEFAVRLYELTEQPPSRAALAEFGFSVGGRSYKIASTSGIGTKAPAVAAMIGDRKGYITEFTGVGYNVRHRVTDWKEDPWLYADGRGPGGAPGEADSAADWPGYPLIGFKPDGGYEELPVRTETWIWRAIYSGAFLAALWWLYFAARRVSAAWASRSSSDILPAAVGNWIMVVGIAVLAIFLAGLAVTAGWRIWGSLIDVLDSALGWAGLGLIALGIVFRLASSIGKRLRA